jgi:hypothetical protein
MYQNLSDSYLKDLALEISRSLTNWWLKILLSTNLDYPRAGKVEDTDKKHSQRISRSHLPRCPNG